MIINNDNYDEDYDDNDDYGDGDDYGDNDEDDINQEDENVDGDEDSIVASGDNDGSGGDDGDGSGSNYDEQSRFSVILTVFFRIVYHFNISNNAASKILAFISFLFGKIVLLLIVH